ncbi:hypothetical protein Trydic_g9941, partial [Trypoxylus dichotomus]
QKFRTDENLVNETYKIKSKQSKSEFVPDIFQWREIKTSGAEAFRLCSQADLSMGAD